MFKFWRGSMKLLLLGMVLVVDFDGDGPESIAWLGSCIEVKFGVDCVDCNYGIL